MKTLYSILTASVFAVALNAQEVTLSQTNDSFLPENINILSCNNTINGYGRLFDLSEYGIFEFLPISIDVGAAVWPGGYTEGHIYSVDESAGDYPYGFDFHHMTDTGLSVNFNNETDELIRDWISLEITEGTYFLDSRLLYVSVVGPVTHQDVGWEGSFVPLPSEGGYIKSAYFGDPNSDCRGSNEFDVNRLDIMGYGEPHGALLITVSGYTATVGLVKLESNQLTVYPNPARDIVQIRVKDNLFIQNISITNLAGHQVYNSKTKENHINIGFLASGIYILKVKDNHNVTHITKLVKK